MVGKFAPFGVDNVALRKALSWSGFGAVKFGNLTIGGRYLAHECAHLHIDW